jgi:hypothetical protein
MTARVHRIFDLRAERQPGILVRPGFPPRRIAIAPVVDFPSFHSSGNPASAACTFASVFGVCSPSSGSAWIARRSATVSGWIAWAASSQPPASRFRLVTMSFMLVSRSMLPFFGRTPCCA